MRKAALAAAVVLGGQVVLVWAAGGGVGSGVYETPAGTLVEEWGDRVANGRRLVPFFARVSLDLGAPEKALTAMIANAVLEGGAPFPLTVRNSSGSRLGNGTLMFRGDYLRETYPTGTQYGYDWRFTASTNGEVVWNGITGWMGGHAWQVTITNVALLPVPWLSISRLETGRVQVLWATNFAEHVLEHTAALPAASWSTVTNEVTVTGERLAVTLDAGVAAGFYRLRRP